MSSALKMTPSVRVNCPSITNNANTATEAIDSGAWRRMTEGGSFTVVIRAAQPKIRLKLATLEPTMFPTPRAGFPLNAAIVDTTSSGAEVPKPKTTAPTTIGLRLRDRAKEVEPSTSQVPDLNKIAKPLIRKTGAMNTRPLMVVSWRTESAGGVLIFHGWFKHHSFVELRDHTSLYLLPWSMAFRKRKAPCFFEILSP